MTISGAEKASPANSASTKPMTPPASNLQSAALPLGPVGLGCRGAVDLGLEKRLFAGVRWLWRTAALRRVLLNGPTKDESWYQTDTGSGCDAIYRLEPTEKREVAVSHRRPWLTPRVSRQ